MWKVWKLISACSVHHGGGGSVHRGDTMSTLGDILSTSGHGQYIGGIS